MKINFITSFFTLFFILLSSLAPAQKSKTVAGTNQRNPASFTINKTDFENLFSKRIKETISVKTNKYLDKSSVLMNSLNGDTRFMKIKLHYFANAYLMVQVNGEYSTQIFVLSDDKSVFYKGRIDNGIVTMTKCNEDDIVSE